MLEWAAMSFSLLPRNEQFFDLFKQMTGEIRSAAGLLEDLLAADPPDLRKIDLIKDAEHRCDTLTHDAIQRLHRTFITPFDREDIYSMATSLDNVMDAIDHAAALVQLYRIATVRSGARELGHVVCAATDRLHTALEALAEKRPVHPHTVEINRLENEGDRIYADAIRTLFDTEHDPIVIIKWKEMFDVLEQITDACEDVANVIESVVVKHG
jgi:predicted phosphate transport protein (TIGR00153 family)